MERAGRLAVALVVLVGAVAGGCGSSGGSRPHSGGPTPEAWSYPEHQFVMSWLKLPLSAAEANQYGFDLDGNGSIDNQLGIIFVALKDQMGETTPQSAVEDAMKQGKIIVLLDVYAQPDMQTAPAANLWELLGVPADPPIPDGPQPGDTFVVDAAGGPAAACLGGSIDVGRGTFGGDDGTFLVHLPLGKGGNVTLPLHAVRIEFTASADGLALEDGRLGGAVRKDDLDSTVVPDLADLLNQEMHAKCSPDGSGVCVCESGSGGKSIQGMFDDNGDCDISVAEVQENGLVKPFLEGDVTFADGSPGLSLGVAFRAIDAHFDHGPPPGQ